MIDNAPADTYRSETPDIAQAGGVTGRYVNATNVRAFDGKTAVVTEMDALVAYLQILGRLTDAGHAKQASADKPPAAKE